MKRADSHLHLFEHGYSAVLPDYCRRRQPSEEVLYDALARQYDITHALIVGFEGESDYMGNNAYLARLRGRYGWLRPVAFVAEPHRLTVDRLQQLRDQGFMGISLYRFSQQEVEQVQSTPPEVWNWITARRWLVSVNSRGEHWDGWPPVLRAHPDLRLLISHLGLPPAHATTPEKARAEALLANVLPLAAFPTVYVKLSGFYALSDPTHDYPHAQAFPYVELLLDRYGPRRLLWGSDYSPSLEHLSFPQTLGVLERMPFLPEADRRRIEGDNLIELFDAIDAA
jgi:L-fuconolactonase